MVYKNHNCDFYKFTKYMFGLTQFIFSKYIMLYIIEHIYIFISVTNTLSIMFLIR